MVKPSVASMVCTVVLKVLTENFSTFGKIVIGRDIETLCYVSQRGTDYINLKLAVKGPASYTKSA